MKTSVIKRLTASVCCVLLLCGSFLPAGAAHGVAELIDECIAYQAELHGAKNAQELIDGYVSDYAGCGSDWLALSLMRYGEWDFSAYRESLEEYVSNNAVENAVSRQRCALMLIACGSESGYIEKTANDSVGENGVMSFVYGLHLLTNGAECSVFTKEQVIEELLALRLEDGGWALGTTGSDVDVTAMAVQALAPYYDENGRVKSAVDGALAMLSQRQLDSGDFSSYGVPNPESTAQVAVALVSLGIDALTDARFIKNSNTLLDGMMKYRLTGGGFCHAEGGNVNTLAGEQVLYALVAMWRNENGKSPLYVFGEEIKSPAETVIQAVPQTEKTQGTQPVTTVTVTSQPVETQASTVVTQEQSVTEALQSDKKENKGSLFGAKGVIITVVLAFGAAAVLYLLLARKSRRGALIAVAAALLAAAVIMSINIQSREGFYSSADESGEITVTLSVFCHTASEKPHASHIPDNGVILPETQLSLSKNSTVLDALMLVSKQHGLLIENESASPLTAYISGINNLYEFDFGELSGWMYFVNSLSPDTGCGEYILKDGDKIEWIYTCNLGDDLK